MSHNVYAQYNLSIVEIPTIHTCHWTSVSVLKVDEQYLLLGTYNGELKFYNVQTAEEYMSSTCHMSMMTNCQPSSVSQFRHHDHR